MSETIVFTMDGNEISAQKGQLIIEAADQAGVYIPRLCWLKELTPSGNCRICTVLVNGRPQTACTQPVQKGAVVLNNTPELWEWRKNIVEMLFVEGNHFCPLCEKSGNCELQALAYRLGMDAPRYPYLFPKREKDASHSNILIDRDRCIQCGRCERAATEIDQKAVFGFVGRGINTSLAVNGHKLSQTEIQAIDRAVSVCPVGAIIRKRIGYAIPIGERLFDREPIGTAVESNKSK